MKYILKNDTSYIINNLIKYIFFIYVVPIIIFLIINNSIPKQEVIVYVMGLNIKFLKSNFLEIIIYIFNVFVSLFLVTSIYLKDLNVGLDNIFLRIEPCKWYVFKTIFFVAFMVILKFIQYLIIFLIIKEVNFSFIIKLAIVDSIYVLFLQFLFFLIYTILSIFGKNNESLLLFMVVYFFLIPKSILMFNSFRLIFLILFIFFSIVCIYKIFKNNYSDLFQNNLRRY